MPAIKILQHRHAFALESLRHDDAGLRTAIAVAPFEAVDDLRIIVAVDNRGEPAESSKFVREAIHFEVIHRALALSQTVDIDDGVQIRCFVVACQGGRFPHRALRAFAIAEEHVRVVRDVVHMGRQHIAQTHGKSLAK